MLYYGNSVDFIVVCACLFFSNIYGGVGLCVCVCLCLCVWVSVCRLSVYICESWESLLL